MENPLEIVEETIEEIVHDVEHAFPAKPGGMVARHREEKARREAAEKEAEQAKERVEESSYKAVKVAPLSPMVTNTITFTITAGTYTQILPLAPYRYSARILSITPEGNVVLAKDSSAALGGVGFTLPTGIVLTINSRAQLYAFNPNAFNITVSVLTEHYSPEQ